MDQKVKADWISALLSGKFKQGAGALKRRFPHRKSEYCCLGVLCNLAEKAGVIKKLPNPGINTKYGDSESSSTYYLPKAVMEWAGLESDRRVAGQDLSVLNDKGQSFEEIAKVIERA